MKEQLINFIFRGIALLGKFLMIFFLAMNFTEYDFGQYGLFTASISILSVLLGLEFYNYSNRELITKQNRNDLILSQLVLQCILYILFFPLPLIFFFSGLIEKSYIIWFYVILVGEHFTQEMFRILVAFSMSNQASLMLLMKAGLWSGVFTYFLTTTSWAKSLEKLFLFWFFGLFMSSIIGIVSLKRKNFIPNIRTNKIQWIWIIKGLKIIFPFLVSTLCIRGMISIDKYILQIKGYGNLVGISTFFMTVILLLQIMVESTVSIVYYPKLVKYYENANQNKYRIYYRKFQIQTVVITLVTALIIILVIEPTLKLLDKESYLKNLDSFYIFLVGSIFFTFSFIPHFKLYSMKKDLEISISSLIGFTSILSLNIVLVPLYNIKGSAISFLISFLLLYISKLIFTKRPF